MFKRGFWLTFGAIVGVVSTWWVERKARRISSSLKLPNIVNSTKDKTVKTATTFGEAFRVGVEETKRSAKELRQEI